MLAPSTLEVLEATPAALRALLGPLPDHAVTMPGPEGWSPRDVLAHVVSVQQPAFIDRVRAIISAERAAIANIDEEQLLASSGLRERNVTELIGLLETVRAESLALVRGLSDEQLERTGRHEIAGDISVSDIVHHMAYHDLMHLRQICALLEHPIDLRRGAMRASFPDTSVRG